MNETRLDAAVRAIGRRGVLRGILAFAAGGLTQPFRDARACAAACAERGPGARCRGGGQCCSNRCKKKKDKRKGTCRCSPLGAQCSESQDCCNHRFSDFASPQCDVKDGSAVFVCCKLNGQSCTETADCRGGMVCIASETCELPLP